MTDIPNKTVQKHVHRHPKNKHTHTQKKDSDSTPLRPAFLAIFHAAPWENKVSPGATCQSVKPVRQRSNSKAGNFEPSPGRSGPNTPERWRKRSRGPQNPGANCHTETEKETRKRERKRKKKRKRKRKRKRDRERKRKRDRERKRKERGRERERKKRDRRSKTKAKNNEAKKCRKQDRGRAR